MRDKLTLRSVFRRGVNDFRGREGISFLDKCFFIIFTIIFYSMVLQVYYLKIASIVVFTYLTYEERTSKDIM